MNRIVLFTLIVILASCKSTTTKNGGDAGPGIEERFKRFNDENYLRLIDYRCDIKKNTTFKPECTVWVSGGGSFHLKQNTTLVIRGSFRPDNNNQIFFGEGKVVFEEGAVEKVDPRWWGAKGDNKNDDAPAIQKAIDCAIRSKGISKVYLSAGQYRLSHPLLIMKDNNRDKKGEFVNFSIEGDQFPYTSNKDIGSNSVLRADFNDRFVIGIVKGKGVTVSNIYFEGKNQLNFSLEQTFEKADKDWAVNGCRNKTFSPYSAVVIDPFGMSVPSDGGYPGFKKYYVQNIGGSSTIHIEKCRMNGFVVGIMINPNGTTKNNDMIRIDDCRIDNVRVAIAPGESQNRSIQCNNVNVWTSTQYCFNTQDYGNGTGVLPEVDVMNIAGAKWLFKASPGWSYGHFSNVYAESLYGIGIAPGLPQPMTFEQCYFKFAMADPKLGIRANPCVLETGNAFFQQSTLRYYSGCSYKAAINFNVKNLVFDACHLEVLPINSFTNTPGERLQNVKLGNTYFECYGDYAQTEGGEKSGIPYQSTNRLLMAGDQRISYVLGRTKDKVTVKHQDFCFDLYTLENVNLNFSTREDLASFTTKQPGRYQVGDILIGEKTIKNIDIKGGARSSMGFVSKVSGNKVSVAGIPYGHSSGSQQLYVARIARYHEPTFGTLKKGSKELTNIEMFSPLTAWKVGDKIKGDGLEEGTYVTAVNNSRRTISISHPAQKSCSSYLFDAIVKREAQMAVPPTELGWVKGDIIWNNMEKQDDVSHWICTKGGVFEGRNRPVFKAVRF